MNDQEKKTKNKKLLTYYLILGACILVLAAIAVAVTLSITLNKDEVIDDGNDQVIDDGGNDDNDDGNDDSTDTSGDTTFGMPVETVNALNSYGFYHNTTLDKYYLHTGIDFAGAAGDEVYAVQGGTVESIVTDPRLMGTTVTIAHENGLKTVYSFVDAAEGLAAGDKVEKGDVIATVAEPMGQEYKDGAHLHFEIFLNDKAVDPEEYLDIDEK